MQQQDDREDRAEHKPQNTTQQSVIKAGLKRWNPFGKKSDDEKEEEIEAREPTFAPKPQSSDKQ